MAGIFDGSTSDLVVTQSATAIEYPVFMVCRYKATDADHRGTLIALSDNAAGGSLDCLALEIRGDAAGNRIHATSTAAGVSSSAVTTVDLIVAGEWRGAIALFESASSRRVADSIVAGLGGGVHREETTTRAVGDWTHLSIGALYDGGATNRFNGKLSKVRLYFGVDAEAILDNPSWLSRVSMTIRPALFLDQVLTRKINDYADWGPTVTNNNVTFDYWGLE